MSILRKGLVGFSLLVLLAGCSAGAISKSPKAEKYSDNEKSAEVQSASPSVTTKGEQATIDRELLSTVSVKLVNGKAELSQPEVSTGAVEFNVRNEMAEPLHVALVKTALLPSKLVVKDGMLERGQMGVDVVSEHANPVKAGGEETITQTLQPGDYELVITAADKSEPVAHAMVTVKPLKTI